MIFSVFSGEVKTFFMANLNNHNDKKEHTSEESSRNIYGGDTSNYGNASQGGVDPAKWKEVPEKASEKSDDADRNDSKRSED